MREVETLNDKNTLNNPTAEGDQKWLTLLHFYYTFQANEEDSCSAALKKKLLAGFSMITTLAVTNPCNYHTHNLK